MDEKNKGKDNLGVRENEEIQSSPVKSECTELGDKDLDQVNGGVHLPDKPNPDGQ